MESEQMAKKTKWRRHTVEFKRQVVERMKTCENIEGLARELNLQRKLLYTWKYQLEGRPEPRHANLATTAEERKEKHLLEEIAKLKAPCSGSRKDASRAPRLAPQRLRRNPVGGARARRTNGRTDVPIGTSVRPLVRLALAPPTGFRRRRCGARRGALLASFLDPEQGVCEKIVLQRLFRQRRLQLGDLLE